MPERQALGRGLAALLREPERGTGDVRSIPLKDIHSNVLQPRKRFDEAGLAELTASIREKGVLQPIVVRRRDAGYEIVLGERRWRAAREAGLDAIPALVRDTSDRESLEIALVENIQREDLNPIELATAYRGLIEVNGLAQEDLARRLGKDRATVANTLRLLGLPEDIQTNLVEGSLTMGHARALLGAASPARQRALRDRILQEGLTVREVERLAREDRAPRARAPREAPRPDPALARLQGDLQRRFQTPVFVRRRGKRGAIEIVFYGDADLDRIVRLMLA
jgi:ParB family chromosome partitioning protein